MGLDDTVFDCGIIPMVEMYVRHFVCKYSEIDELSNENLELWESTLCYSGYSVAFHTLYPLYKNTHLDGFGYNEVQERLLIPKLKTKLRNHIIQIMHDLPTS
jgi:hypothetical protein